MKVLFVVWNTDPCGGVRAIFEIAEGLAKRNHNVRIISLGGKHDWHNISVPIDYVKPNQSRPQLGRLGLDLYRRLKHPANYLDMERLMVQFFGFHLDLLQTLSRSIPDCDVCIATWYQTAFPVWIAQKGQLFYFMQDFPEQMEGFDDDYDVKLFERTLNLPFRFLTNSSYTKGLILQHQSDADVKVVGVGVDTKTFYPRSSDVAPSKFKKVMVILKKSAFKGSEVAIRTLNEVNKKVPIHAFIVGSIKPLKEFATQFRYTHFKFVDDDKLARLYSSADVFLFTSYSEGFGLPPLEAMACGTPVVTTDCKGNRDYAIDRYNCLMVNPGDCVALTKSVLKVIEDKRLADNLRAGGLKTARDWTWDRAIARFEESLLIDKKNEVRL